MWSSDIIDRHRRHVCQFHGHQFIIAPFSGGSQIFFKIYISPLTTKKTDMLSYKVRAFSSSCSLHQYSGSHAWERADLSHKRPLVGGSPVHWSV